MLLSTTKVQGMVLSTTKVQGHAKQVAQASKTLAVVAWVAC